MVESARMWKERWTEEDEKHALITSCRNADFGTARSGRIYKETAVVHSSVCLKRLTKFTSKKKPVFRPRYEHEIDTIPN